MLIQWLVLSKLSKDPSKLHNTASITFLLITFGCSGLQTDYAGTMFKTLQKGEGHRRSKHFCFPIKIKAKPESRWLGVWIDFVDDC